MFGAHYWADRILTGFLFSKECVGLLTNVKEVAIIIVVMTVYVFKFFPPLLL